MQKIEMSDLLSLEEYAKKRDEYRKKVMQHKLNRQLAIGENIRLFFEDRVTMMYQLQEILRVERIFEIDEIGQELEAYNPLIPDGKNWKATLMIEYSNPEIRKERLACLLGIDKKVWMQVDESEKIYPVTNEDLMRETEEKTSAVHFLRFELTTHQVQELKNNASLKAGVDHSECNRSIIVPANIRQSLVADLD